MKTEARYAIDGKTHYSVMKEIPVPKELKGFVTKSFIMAISETFNTRHAAEIALQKLLQKEVKKEVGYVCASFHKRFL